MRVTAGDVALAHSIPCGTVSIPAQLHEVKNFGERPRQAANSGTNIAYRMLGSQIAKLNEISIFGPIDGFTFEKARSLRW